MNVQKMTYEIALYYRHHWAHQIKEELEGGIISEEIFSLPLNEFNKDVTRYIDDAYPYRSNPRIIWDEEKGYRLQRTGTGRTEIWWKNETYYVYIFRPDKTTDEYEEKGKLVLSAAVSPKGEVYVEAYSSDFGERHIDALIEATNLIVFKGFGRNYRLEDLPSKVLASALKFECEYHYKEIGEYIQELSEANRRETDLSYENRILKEKLGGSHAGGQNEKAEKARRLWEI